MAASREGRLQLALGLCMRDILESCSEEQFMSHFSGCAEEYDASSLHDLAGLFRQFLQLSMQVSTPWERTHGRTVRWRRRF